jgi:hypothetical protein
MWLIAGGVLIVLAIACLLWKRRSRKLASASPREAALASLRQLESSGAKLGAEEFANRAAGTLREYIAARFGLAAPRRTTEEFLRDVEGSPLLGESDHLRTFLKSCDLAKFAGADLDSSQRDELILAARSFIRANAAEPSPTKAGQP